MKHLKKLASLLLALVMGLSLATTAFAAESNGSITVNSALKGETYTIYRIFDLESYSGTNYSYKLSEKWSGFTANDYFTVNTDGYVEWKEAKNTTEGAAAFAALAMAYAKENNIVNDGQATATADGTVSFSNLPLGYYLVDTTLGSLCALSTTDPDATVTEKNEKPTNEKTVEEDSTGNYGNSNDADINQVVNFKSTITVQKGTENYVLHDKMSTGLTFDNTSVKVTVDGTEVAATGNWTLITTTTDDCTFEVKFENSYISTLTAGKEIVVSYSATLNENAVIGSTGNPNETTLTYGNDQETEKSETVTKTWGVDLFKYTKGENDAKNALAGAEFVLYKEVANTDTTEGAAATVKKYATVANGKLTGWVDTEEAATKLTSDSNGIISVDGLDADTYYFKETKAPAGYNLLKDPVQFVIGNDGTVKMGETTVTQVEVENNAGSELPSTGGMGTTIFYTLGGILMLAAVVLLVTKRRMNAR